MQGICTYIPKINYVSREYSVAAVLLLLFMVLVSVVSVLNLLYFYISTFRSTCSVPNVTAFWIAIHFLLIFCKMLSAIHIAPYHFSYSLFCPSPSLFFLCMFHCILGLVALTVSEWSTLSCLVAVTFLGLRSTRFPATPVVSIPGLQE